MVGEGSPCVRTDIARQKWGLLMTATVLLFLPRTSDQSQAVSASRARRAEAANVEQMATEKLSRRRVMSASEAVVGGDTLDQASSPNSRQEARHGLWAGAGSDESGNQESREVEEDQEQCAYVEHHGHRVPLHGNAGINLCICFAPECASARACSSRL